MLKDFLNVPTGLQMVDPICRFRWGQLFFWRKNMKELHTGLYIGENGKIYKLVPASKEELEAYIRYTVYMKEHSVTLTENFTK